MYTRVQTTTYSCEAFQNEYRLEGRGLSGEHIELCAEGARLRPNLSGKQTEERHLSIMPFFPEPLFSAAPFLFPQKQLPLTGVRSRAVVWLAVYGMGRNSREERGQKGRNSTRRRIWKWFLSRFAPCRTPAKTEQWFAASSVERRELTAGLAPAATHLPIGLALFYHRTIHP